VDKSSASAPPLSPASSLLKTTSRLPRAYLNFVGRQLLRLTRTLQELGAFALITLGVMFTRYNEAAQVVHPLMRAHVVRAGVRLVPMILFLACALGLVVIGQTVALLSRVGAQSLIGTVMVTVVVRELGPMITALLVLARIGTAYVIELGTARALGELEALEALGVDPIHYLVLPRVIGLAVSIFALTVYLIIGTVLSGYAFAFLQDVPLMPGDYFRQLAGALSWMDFLLLALKTCCFGVVIAIVTCYHGLAQPIRLEDVSSVTIRAVVHSMVICVLLDALFIIVYLVA
jgi:phospholipid/cholesterol/gamma-HCH transport system permease protein